MATKPIESKEESFLSKIQWMGLFGIIISNILLFVLLCLRWKESGHFPLSNLYESLMFLSWCFTTLHLFLSKNSSFNDQIFLGAITTPSALFTNAFATITLPKEMQEASPLVPALQSNWLMMHVTVMILSYAALILGSLLSIAFLVVTSIPVKENKDSRPSLSTNENGSVDSFYHKGKSDSLREQSDTFGVRESTVTTTMSSTRPRNRLFDINALAFYLDNLSYRILGIGFPFLTIGILSGAVWANEAWGSYWSWDPKETWALLTWLVFAIYLHIRLKKNGDYSTVLSSQQSVDAIPSGPKGSFATTSKIDKTPAMIASFGFIIVWMCYLGVNLLGEGLHSYGWISTSS
jgi:cytochrome c-type biogenesis protein CcsB